jgi:hypothetical protein
MLVGLGNKCNELDEADNKITKYCSFRLAFIRVLDASNNIHSKSITT